MRISDWSSDVCSSDLRGCFPCRHPGLDPGSTPAPLERMPDQVRHDEVGEIDLRAPEVYYIHNSPRRHPMRLAFLIPPMLLLAACGQGADKKDATEIAINADGADGGVQIKTQIGRA